MNVDQLLEQEARRSSRRPEACKYAVLLDELDDDTRQKIVDRHGQLPYSALARVMRGLGKTIAEQTVRLHVRGECCCDG